MTCGRTECPHNRFPVVSFGLLDVLRSTIGVIEADAMICFVANAVDYVSFGFYWLLNAIRFSISCYLEWYMLIGVLGFVLLVAAPFIYGQAVLCTPSESKGFPYTILLYTFSLFSLALFSISFVFFVAFQLCSNLVASLNFFCVLS